MNLSFADKTSNYNNNTLILTEMEERFDLGVSIQGQNAMQYMADLIERNENQQIEIERGKLSVSILKQMNNRSRLLLDAAKFELKERESEVKAFVQ